MIHLERTPQVWCICGNLGGGKTLTAVSMAVQAIKQGYFVVSNVTLDIAKLSKSVSWASSLYKHIVVHNEEYDESGNLVKVEDFNPFTIPSGSPRGTNGGKRVLVILDECAEWFDQYQNAKSTMMKRVTSWLRHSSKRSQDVIFIVQRREYLNKTFRILVSRWVFVDDMATWRFPVFHCVLPFTSNLIMTRVLDKSDNRISPVSFIRKTDFGCYYNTAECLAVNGLQAFEYEYVRPQDTSFLYLLVFWLGTLIYLLTFS